MKALLALLVVAGMVGTVVRIPDDSPAACVRLAKSEPFQPEEAAMPSYPKDAHKAGVEGDVALHFDVGSGCAPEDVAVDEGPEPLRQAAADAAKNWKYCGVPEGQEIHATVSFRLHCPAK